MIIEELLSLFGQDIGSKEREVKCSITPLETSKSNTTRAMTDKFANDVAAINVFYPLEKESKIEISLQTLLAIAPRKRPRIEAYQGLVSYVREKYGVELTIKSRKTK